jgi:hypothetical protein
MLQPNIQCGSVVRTIRVFKCSQPNTSLKYMFAGMISIEKILQTVSCTVTHLQCMHKLFLCQYYPKNGCGNLKVNIRLK